MVYHRHIPKKLFTYGKPQLHLSFDHTDCEWTKVPKRGPIKKKKNIDQLEKTSELPIKIFIKKITTETSKTMK